MLPSLESVITVSLVYYAQIQEQTTPTCERILKARSTGPQLRSLRIRLQELNDLIYIAQRQLIPLQELLSRSVGVLRNVVGKFEGGSTFRDVNIEDVVVFDALIELLAA